MPGRKEIFKDMLLIYEKKRSYAEEAARKRKQKLYENYPRLKDIDGKLAELSIAAARLALFPDEALALKIKTESGLLRKEKARFLNELGITEDYFAPEYECKNCNDTGYDRNNKLCSCFKQQLTEKILDSSGLKDTFKAENFDSFDIRLYSNEKTPREISPLENIQEIFNIALRFCNNFDSKYANLLLYGNPGLGKTFLCNSIAKDLLDKGKNVIYVTAPQMFKKIEERKFSYGKENFEEIYDLARDMSECDLLIIDDLGTEFSTSFTLSELFDIINTRLLAKKSIIISTNLNLNEIKGKYTDRIASRITGNFYTLNFFGEDIRLKNKK